MWLALGWTFSVVTLVGVIFAQFYRWSSRLILSDGRGVLKNGILLRRSTEIVLPNALIEYALVDPLLNHGTQTVRGFDGSRDSMKRMPKPERVRELTERPPTDNSEGSL
jgi:hypothetical protein